MNHRFPRSMNEAFPRTPQYACAIEVGRRSAWWHLMRLLRSLID